MRIVSDTSVIIAVISGEPEKAALVEITQGVELIAPDSLHWEVGNALSAQLRRGRLIAEQVPLLLRAYRRIPIQFLEISHDAALEVAAAFNIYAYDAYMIACSVKYRVPLITLDRGLVRVAQEVGVEVMEV